MYMRLAFSVAVSVAPDIVVIDEALSVGDGAFARKSFDRIMAMKEAGKTILFCSHAMYHVDVMCQRALWLENGRVRMLGEAAQVTSAYNTALALESEAGAYAAANKPAADAMAAMPAAAPSAGTGRISRVHGTCDGESGQRLSVKSLASTVAVTVEFAIDPALPLPSVALGIENAAGLLVSSVISKDSAGAVTRDARGMGRATVVFQQIPLLKGEYRVTAFLGCEQGVHVYDYAPQCLTLDVCQVGVLQGVVVLPHTWQTDA
jgi:lipopolysaccharide transport system ATP-binding protein